MIYPTHLLQKKEIAERTIAFYFEKPADFSYLPGQYISLVLPRPNYHRYEFMREFSLFSSPHEDFLGVAVRMRESTMKKELGNLKLGDTAEIEGPFGEFVLPDEIKRPLVFLAGGIGITPFYSMIKTELTKHTPRKMTLITANRRIHDIPFYADLAALHKEGKLTFIPTLTAETPENWTGESGYISKALLQKNLASPTDSFYLLAGPPRMVGALWSVLDELGIPAGQILGEEFTGYGAEPVILTKK